MTLRLALHGLCFAGLVAGWATGPAAGVEAALQPYQMVRSLQLVQDRIADGDHAAVPMQRKLLEMIDARLLHASNEDLADERNLRAVLVYAMSGGNPQTIEATLLKLKLDGTDKALSIGVVNYLRGRPTAAQSVLASTDPVDLLPELGAFVALIKGSVAADADPAGALRLLDQARLLGPGTLVEEAALRRSVSLAVTLADHTRFLRASSLYARRYLGSPYASQFADAFVAGVVALDGKLSLEAVDEITTWITAEQRQIVYLRIARRAAIDGLKPLAEFASSKAREGSGAEDARALLYSMLGTVASETEADAMLKLRKIDRNELSKSDLELLDAVTAVAGRLTAVPPPVDGKAPPVTEPDARMEPQPAHPELANPAAAAKQHERSREPVVAQPEADQPGAAPEELTPAAQEASHAAVPESAEPAEPVAHKTSIAPTGSPPGTTAPAAAPQNGSPAAPQKTDPTEEMMQVARRKLDAVDKLLEETAQ